MFHLHEDSAVELLDVINSKKNQYVSLYFYSKKKIKYYVSQMKCDIFPSELWYIIFEYVIYNEVKVSTSNTYVNSDQHIMLSIDTFKQENYSSFIISDNKTYSCMIYSVLTNIEAYTKKIIEHNPNISNRHQVEYYDYSTFITPTLKRFSKKCRKERKWIPRHLTLKRKDFKYQIIQKIKNLLNANNYIQTNNI